MLDDGRLTMSTLGIHEGLNRIRAEYQEMPGMRLTCEQVARLCGLDRTASHDVLEALVTAGYLHRSDDGRYGRPADSRAQRRVAGSASRVMRASSSGR